MQYPGEMHPKAYRHLNPSTYIYIPYICWSTTKGFKRSVQAWGTRVNANTHLVPTPPATQGSSRGSARPQGGCILAGGGLLSCPEPLRTWDTEGPPPRLCFAGQDLGFCPQLAGSVAAGTEGTAGLESWGMFGAASGWGRPGEILCWVKRSGAPARAWRLSTSGWDPPPGRPTRPPRPSLNLNSSTPPSNPRQPPASIHYRLFRGTSNCHAFQAWDKRCAL